MRIYSLYDRKLREFGGLVLAKNDDAVKRAMQEGISGNNTVAKYPQDYDLKCLGDFNDETGEITPLRVVRLVDSVKDILVQGESVNAVYDPPAQREE